MAIYHQEVSWWDNIPLALRDKRQFMVCRRDNKRPLNAKTGYFGEKDNPEHWVTFGDACYLAEENDWLIGFVPTLNDPFTIIDIDNKPGREYSPEVTSFRNSLLDWAYQQTYVEVSSSGRGYHIVVEGKLANDFNDSDYGIEAYGHKGFVILTGNAVAGSPSHVASLPELIAYLDEKFAKHRAAVEDVEYADIIAKLQIPASAAELAMDQQFGNWFETFSNAEKIRGWFNGDDETEDRSKVDAQLLQLYYKFNRNRPEREVASLRMFLRSPRARWLGRKKGNMWRYLLSETLAFVKTKIHAEESAESTLKEVADRAYTEFMYKEQEAARITAQNAIAQATNSSVPPLPIPPRPENPFKFFTASELKKRPPIEWAVRNLLPTSGLAAIWGASGSGKSFLALDLMAAVATGSPWFNMKTRQLPVCCLALEGAGGLQKRVLAYEKGKGVAYPESVMFYDGDFNLRGNGPIATGGIESERLGLFCAALNNGHGKFQGVILIDTLNQASNGADENSSRDMGQLISAMKYIQQQTDSLVIAVHHATKSAENQSMRGHGSFQAACDSILEVTKDKDDKRAWVSTKVKDGADDHNCAFELAKEILGFDEDGVVDSCYVKPIVEEMIDRGTGEIVQTIAPMAPKWSGNERGGGNERGNSGGRKKAESAKEISEREAVNGSNHSAIREAIIAVNINAASANTGKHGAPEGVHCAPREEVIEVAVQIRNAPDPAQSKKNIKNALTRMMELGKLGSRMEPGGKQWLWAVSEPKG